MRHPIRLVAVIMIVAATVWLLPEAAKARADGDTYCSLPQTFGAALRYLRVDLGLEVTEKDADAAYLLFRYRVPGEPKREVPGAIEFVRLDKKVRIFVKIPQMPVLHEQLLRDGLLKKLAQEYGDVGRISPEKPKNSNPDAGSIQ